jgi:hypothetical protein
MIYSELTDRKDRLLYALVASYLQRTIAIFRTETRHLVQLH